MNKRIGTAWVTGSSRGIGRAIAEAFAAAGHNVVIHGRNRTNLSQTGEGEDLEKTAGEMSRRYGTGVMALCGDLTREGVVRDITDKIRNRFGSIDFLICNAGGGNLSGRDDPATPRGTCLEFDLADWKKRIDQQLLPTVLCCREVAPLMAERAFGRIITIGSIAACGGNKTMGGNAPYAAAKAAVQQYTRCLAGQLRHANIPVNCVVPGNINTPYTRATYGGERITPDPGKSRLEQIGKPEDIASLVLFLCGPGGEYISGQLIRVDGGEQLYPC